MTDQQKRVLKRRVLPVAAYFAIVIGLALFLRGLMP